MRTRARSTRCLCDAAALSRGSRAAQLTSALRRYPVAGLCRNGTAGCGLKRGTPPVCRQNRPDGVLFGRPPLLDWRQQSLTSQPKKRLASKLTHTQAPPPAHTSAITPPAARSTTRSSNTRARAHTHTHTHSRTHVDTQQTAKQ